MPLHLTNKSLLYLCIPTNEGSLLFPSNNWSAITKTSKIAKYLTRSNLIGSSKVFSLLLPLLLLWKFSPEFSALSFTSSLNTPVTNFAFLFSFSCESNLIYLNFKITNDCVISLFWFEASPASKSISFFLCVMALKQIKYVLPFVSLLHGVKHAKDQCDAKNDARQNFVENCSEFGAQQQSGAKQHCKVPVDERVRRILPFVLHAHVKSRKCANKNYKIRNRKGFWRRKIVDGHKEGRINSAAFMFNIFQSYRRFRTK